MMTNLAIYAGTFDPLTFGHMDLIVRSAAIFDQLILGVAIQSRKQTLFTVDERLEMMRAIVGGTANVEVDAFEGLLVDYAQRRGCKVLIRGLRAYSDFEYEFQMALTNRKMAPELETLFMMPKETHSYLSSSVVKEVAQCGGDVSLFVPEQVQDMLYRKYGTVRA